MSRVVTTGYTDTAISGVSSLSFPRGLVNFTKDFCVQKNGTTDVTLTNLTCPVDQPERFRFAISDIANIYANSGIDASVWAPNHQGQSLLIQVSEVISVTDSADPSYRVDLPVTCNITIKSPKSGLVTADHLLTLLGRAVSGAFEVGSTTNDGMKRLEHGSLVPAGL